MICQKCKGVVFESGKAIVTFIVEGGKASFTTNGEYCINCGQVQAKFQVNVKEIPQIMVEQGENKCQERTLQ